MKLKELVAARKNKDELRLTGGEALVVRAKRATTAGPRARGPGGLPLALCLAKGLAALGEHCELE
jgi:hypothetical protein